MVCSNCFGNIVCVMNAPCCVNCLQSPCLTCVGVCGFRVDRTNANQIEHHAHSTRLGRYLLINFDTTFPALVAAEGNRLPRQLSEGDAEAPTSHHDHDEDGEDATGEWMNDAPAFPTLPCIG